MQPENECSGRRHHEEKVHLDVGQVIHIEKYFDIARQSVPTGAYLAATRCMGRGAVDTGYPFEQIRATAKTMATSALWPTSYSVGVLRFRPVRLTTLDTFSTFQTRLLYPEGPERL